MKFKKIVLAILITLFALLLFTGGGYTYWNSAAPAKSCASCHEIQQSIVGVQASAHRDLLCKDCHGTALSNGIHSVKEKSNMVFRHVKEKVVHEDIHLNESQVLELSTKCATCHQSEFKKWQAGKHSANYKDIFLDSRHNSIEAPYPDCLRCHGMFYDRTMTELMEPLSTKGPWSLMDPNKMMESTIPCMSCHQIHTNNNTVMIATADTLRNPSVGLYIRSDKIYLRADKLLKPEYYHKGKEVKVSDDPDQRICERCHAPNDLHEVGSQDDRTPVGVHEGLSCNSCHTPHSNDASGSCILCHPAISNCKLDVRTMNTSYYDPKSPNDIHFVSCSDCHSDMKEKISKSKMKL